MADAGRDELFAAARAAMDRAYAPYSKFHVGAAARGADGRVYAGPNVENAAYPQGWCAECSALAAMVASGETRLTEFVVLGAPEDGRGGYVDQPDLLCTPCGGCRQKLREFGALETPIHVGGPDGIKRSFTLDELLPASFGPDNLAEP